MAVAFAHLFCKVQSILCNVFSKYLFAMNSVTRLCNSCACRGDVYFQFEFLLDPCAAEGREARLRYDVYGLAAAKFFTSVYTHQEQFGPTKQSAPALLYSLRFRSLCISKKSSAFGAFSTSALCEQLGRLY